MTEIAFASGFQSVRRFNAVFRERYGMAPSRVRRRGGRTRAATLTLNFAARGAFDAAAPLRDLALHAVDGVEAGHDGGWVRSLRLGPHAGWIVLQIVAAVRGAFDLDSDIEAIAAALGRSFPEAAPVRLPGALDAFEATARTIIGQQVTLAAARTLAGRIVERFGEPIETPFPGVTRLFPSAERLAQARADQISALGMPRKRGETLRSLARAVADEKIRLARGAVAVGRAGLAGLAGVGPWTIEYAALRALGDPDAFPGGDAVLKAAFEGDVARASEAWRPWRGYAAALLWRRNHAQRIAA
jgi:AraC family transcriptional regulator of adaptative response / DNA-3-methyladenine glycosylase II